MCILSPKLVEAGRHLNIEIIPECRFDFSPRRTGHLRQRSESGLATSISKNVRAAMTAHRSVLWFCQTSLIRDWIKEKPSTVPIRRLCRMPFLVTKRGTSPCKNTCPAETSAQGYIALIQTGRYPEALRVIKEYNPFPATVDGSAIILAKKTAVAGSLTPRWRSAP